jgi:hypothetical protein
VRIVRSFGVPIVRAGTIKLRGEFHEGHFSVIVRERK